MNFVKNLKYKGVRAKEIPAITGAGSPTSLTEGAVGCLYMDENSGEMYKCTAVNDGVYTWVLMGGSAEGAVLYTEQRLTPEQQAQARANIDAIGGADRNPDRHTAFFEITSDGIVVLKQEYRGATTQSKYPYSISDMGEGVAGSKNAELPKYLAVPEIVDGVTVNGFGDGAFCDNAAIVEVVLPDTISEIPAYCFYGCYNLKEIYNTENIKALGARCFRQCSDLRRAKFSNLETMGEYAFMACARLVYADIGNATELPLLSFAYCNKLKRIKNNGKVTTAGEVALLKAVQLEWFDNIDKLTQIVTGAFIGPKIDADWSSLQAAGCTFGSNATPLQFNSQGIGENAGEGFAACENPLPTYFAQTNPELKGRAIGSSGMTYNNGCVLFSFVHSYCGLTGIHLDTIDELEQHFNGIDPDILNGFINNDEGIQRLCSLTGLTDVVYTNYISDTSDKNKIVKAVYQAVTDGKYAIVVMDNGYGTMKGHVAVIYGINSNGEFLAVDSSSRYYDDFTQPYTYAFEFDKFISPNTTCHILSLQEA